MKGENGMYSKVGRTAFMIFFGQQVVEEILDAQGSGCPPEYFNINITQNHEYRNTDPKVPELPLLRTRYDMNTGFSPNNPRQQLNEITPYLDGGLVYGTSKGWADVLRLFSNGTVAPRGKLGWHDELGEGFPAQNTQRLPMANPPPPTNHSQYVERGYTANVNRFFKLGNPRGNENPFLLTFGIFWFRWHNHIADYLHTKYGSAWTDERIFNEARKWVIATYQSIIMNDWLPKYMRANLTTYQGYNPSLDPQVSHVFQSAAMRFGHTLVTSGVYLRDRRANDCNPQSYKLSPETEGPPGILGVRTCNSFWRSPELFLSDPQNFERFLMGLSSQSTEREDHIIVEDLRGRVFGPLEFSRRDLMAVNIQRGRDHGLPDYNTARKHFGLDPVRSLEYEDYRSVTKTQVVKQIIDEMKDLYKNVSEVDIWPGGLMETTDAPGQLFSKIILDQFQRTRDGDRFWFENENNGLFTENEICRLRNIKIVDILLSITNLVPGDDIQVDPFTAIHQGNNIHSSCTSKMEMVNCTLRPPSSGPCFYLEQLSNSNAEQCSKPRTYDYFSGSEASYILTFASVLIACVGVALAIIINSKMKAKQSARNSLKTIKVTENAHKAKERVAHRETRYVIILLDPQARRIQVNDTRGNILRMIDFTHVSELTVKHLQDYSKMILKITNHYDLFLMFQDDISAQKLKHNLETFCESNGIRCIFVQESNVSLYQGLMTVYERENMLAEFSRLVLSTAFSDSTVAWLTGEMMSRFQGQNKVLSMEITQSELASQLGMLPDSIFVQQLFHLMDYNKNGFITIKEFWDVMVVFAQGSKEEKAKLMFNIYDLSHTGSISASDLMNIVKSTLGSEGKNRDLEQVVKTMLQSVGLREGQTINFEKFKQIFDTESGVFENVCIDMDKAAKKKTLSRSFSLYGAIPVGGLAAENARKEYEEARQELLTQEEKKEEPAHTNLVKDRYRAVVNKIKSNEQYLFLVTLYTIVMLLIFVERAYYYTIEREHGGLRRIAGLGVTVTRGAASAMMFTFSTLLVTMCRNLLSHLRSTSLHRFFPFDDMVSFHRYVGHWALFWTVIHIVGHAINFYHISTQTPSDLLCIFRDYFRSTHILPKFHYWCWETITGLTGVFLTLQTAVIYAFAYFGRQHFFIYFWWTHNTYPLFYIFMILHGSGRLVQDPFFHFFFLGPCILFAIDKVISMSRNRIRIDVKSAVQLPSNVTLLKIRRPPDFNFQSGQWVRIASLGISDLEYHPFTLSSAPHEEDLTLHIRAVGPWTWKLRSIYPDQSQMKGTDKYPQVYMDGPFGEGHQMWWNFEVVIFVAGGIGITPFASILKDIAHKLQTSKGLMRTKKVMFLWVTKSQKQFEWMTDVLRKVEAADSRNIIRTHIFITQFKSKYDLRTIMLYLAERHFQRLSGTSLFTGLRAITHFSRPDFTSVFKSIKKRYSTVPVIGVFTCGNPALSGAVDEGCQIMNKEESPVFKHYYENF